MRSSFGKLVILAVLAIFVGSAIYRIFGINRSVSEAIVLERSRLKLKNKVPFEKTGLSPHDAHDVQILQNAREVRDLALFQESWFAATSGGLLQISPDGKMLRHFTVLDGLPESDLTSIAVFDGKLYIGTRTKGLVVFDGTGFELYIFTDRNVQAITSFLEDEGRLLIGTVGGGLLEFDGKIFTEIKSEKGRIAAVNCLRKFGPRPYIGTFDNGLYIYEGDTWTHFSTSDGLPSNRVVGIESFRNSIYAATDFGLARLENQRFQNVATIPALAGSAMYDGSLLLIRDSGEIYSFEKTLKQKLPQTALEQARLVPAANKLWLISNRGISLLDGTKLQPFGEIDSPVTDNFISALAFDRRGELWIGTFRRGIDIFTPGGSAAKHIETESIREINFLQISEDSVSAATSSGLIHFDGETPAKAFTTNDGLPSNSVMHFSKNFIATARGLTFTDNGRVRTLSTVQGLPNNSVYATLEVGEKLYAGTLGGLAEIEDRRVVRTFTDANSKLHTNWVTALCMANNRLFIGTYGGGVFELLGSGEVRSFDGETGKFAVNPNAIYTDDERLYVGTLTGVKILDLQTQAWRTVVNILPSETVMSIAGQDEKVFFGTSAGLAIVDKRYFGEK